jgi:hypothetical protein
MVTQLRPRRSAKHVRLGHCLVPAHLPARFFCFRGVMVRDCVMLAGGRRHFDYEVLQAGIVLALRRDIS